LNSANIFETPVVEKTETLLHIRKIQFALKRNGMIYHPWI